ncbi:MAG TPA: urea transporter [Ktedonobacteraceae bacterium]|nr:urea transporter [Ktedonobacteraceae bacterium]
MGEFDVFGGKEMARVSLTWENGVQRNSFIQFIDINLRGAGQVMFQNNPLTGLLFIIGIFWGAIAAGSIAIGIGAVVALLISTLTAMVLNVDIGSLRQGLYGFNGILVGIGVATFIQNTPLMWVYLIIGAALSTVAMLAITNLMKNWGMAALTFPFVLTTWFLLLAVYQFTHLPIGSLGPPALPLSGNLPGTNMPLTVSFLLTGWITGVSQVFLINNVVTGIIFVIALAVSSWQAAILALVGAAVGLSIALLFGANAHGIGTGLYGFSAVLTAIALGSVFYSPSFKVVLYTIVGVILTVIVQAALNTALSPIGIPTLTAPFVLATWLFLLPKEQFAPETV